MNFPAWMSKAPGAELASFSLLEAAEKLRSGKVSSLELTQACLARIAALDDTLHAFITVMAEFALADARQADASIANGDYRGPLHGIPIAVKDLIDIAGLPTTAASHVFANRIAAADAVVVRQLCKAGAVILGKTNLHEFAYGGSGMISAYGITRNPQNPSRIAGGSSSGSAAAVAAGMCFAAIGTDTAGSIRLPAAYCGVVGLKPTWGIISTEGVVPLAETYDHVGPITRTVQDASAVMNVLAPNLPAGKPAPIRIGIARRYFFENIDSELAAAVEGAIQYFESKQLAVSDIDVPVEEDRTAQAYESYRYHKEFIAAGPDLYDQRTLQRILRGREISTAQYQDALNRTVKLRTEAVRLFQNVDVIVTPTVPIPPPAVAELEADPEALRAREILMLRNTRPFNVLGLPTLSVPCGQTKNGLPVGLQFTTAENQDYRVLEAGRLIEHRK